MQNRSIYMMMIHSFNAQISAYFTLKTGGVKNRQSRHYFRKCLPSAYLYLIMGYALKAYIYRGFRGLPTLVPTLVPTCLPILVPSAYMPTVCSKAHGRQAGTRKVCNLKRLSFYE